MSSVCRRRLELQTLGVRPETLAWAVAEASEPAIALSELSGSEMVRTCLEQACDPRTSGTESEALLILAAAGVGQVRRELRSLGVSVPLDRHEAFREVRRAGRKASPDHKAAFEAIRAAGASRIVEMILDRTTTFTEALAEEIVQASREGENERVRALIQVGAFGPRALHRGIKVDITKEVMAIGVTTFAEMVAGRSPRRALRVKARMAEGQTADTLAALSFIRTPSLKRAARIATDRSREQALREMNRARRAVRTDHDAIYRAVGLAGPLGLMNLVDGAGASFERVLAGRIVEAFDIGEPKGARALIDIGAFGVGGLRRGIRVDVSEDLGGLSSPEIAEIAVGDLPQRVLRNRARAAVGQRAGLFAALSFVEPRCLRRSATKALRRQAARSRLVAECRPDPLQGDTVVERDKAYA
jgi:hypothetical protein